jgi:glycosyltransferase involved in cell wall biosynthesis
MGKIRVLQVLPMLAPGGAERVAVHIAKGLDPDRYKTAILSLGPRVGSDLERLLDEARIEIKCLGKTPGFDHRMYPRLLRLFSDWQPDIVHTHIQVLRYVLPTTLLFRNTRFVHTVHNLAEYEVEPKARWIQRYSFRHGVVPIAVAEKVALSLSQLYQIQECKVILNGIPTSQYARPRLTREEWRRRERFEDDDVLFVSVARFAPQKNHALLLNAFASGLGQDSKAHLVLVGDGQNREQLEAQARELGIRNQVRFLGLRTDIPEVLGAMDVFVLSSDFEGNPLSVMEAMASGLPIVSTAVGGIPDLVEDRKEGMLVRAGDVNDLASSMTLLMREEETRRGFGRAAALRAREQFDVSKMVEAYEEVYDEMVQGSGPLAPGALVDDRAVPA